MWRFEGTTARASFENLSLSVSTEPGQRQLCVQSQGGLQLATLWHMPQVSSQPLIENYVRGNDLVCTLGPSQEFPFTTQLYWTPRKLASLPLPIVAVSLVVSIRTDLLDTEPAVEIVSKGLASDRRTCQEFSGPAYAVTLDDRLTLLDFATPEDCQKQTLNCVADRTAVIDRSLFGHFLEKGVIRTGRLHAALFDGDLTSKITADVCDELAASELPLTT